MKSNKSVKAMICKLLDDKWGFKHPFGHYFDESGCLMICYISGSAPDDYYEDFETAYIGLVSLDSNGNIQAVSKG